MAERSALLDQDPTVRSALQLSIGHAVVSAPLGRAVLWSNGESAESGGDCLTRSRIGNSRGRRPEHELGDVMVSTVADAAHSQEHHRAEGLPADDHLDRGAATAVNNERNSHAVGSGENCLRVIGKDLWGAGERIAGGSRKHRRCTKCCARVGGAG